MRSYSITYLPTNKSINVPCPEDDLQPGQKLQLSAYISTFANVSYHPGDVFQLISRDLPKHNHLSSLGNWNVQCKHFNSSNWSSIEFLVAKGMLQLIE